MIVKEVKLRALSWGIRIHQYLDDWLIRAQSPEESSHNTKVVVDLTKSLGWMTNQVKLELIPTQVFSFVGYEYHLNSALVKPTQERWQKTTGINPQDNPPVRPDCKIFDVTHWVASINRKNGPRRPPSHETFSVASQGELDISSVVEQAPSRCRSPPPRTQHSSVYRRLKRRLGRSLKSRFYQRTVVRSRKIIAHKRFRTKGSVLGPKTLQASMPKSNSPGCHGQLNGSSLHQQTGQDSLSRDVGPSMENHELVSLIQNISTCQTHSRLPKCDRGLPVQINSNSVNGVVTIPSGVQKNLHKVVHTSGGPVCHSAKPQLATIRLSSSRSKRMEHRCSKHKLVKPCSLCLPSNSSTSKSNTKCPPVQLPPNPDSPGLAGHVLVLGSGPSISGNSTSVACISKSTH